MPDFGRRYHEHHDLHVHMRRGVAESPSQDHLVGMRQVLLPPSWHRPLLQRRTAERTAETANLGHGAKSLLRPFLDDH